MADHHAQPRPAFDPLDPHGFGEAYHEEHHVTSALTLVVVLVALLVFTVLTVGQAVAEGAIAEGLDIDIPHWVNIAIVMGIAVVKGTLVALYFMHLRHDNRLNAVIFVSCLFVLGLFLGLTMIDLDRRTTLYEWKDDHLIQGGTQYGIQTAKVDEKLGLSRASTSIVEFARQRYIREHGAMAWLAEHPENLTRWIALRSKESDKGDRYAAFWRKWLEEHGPASAEPAAVAEWARTISARQFFAAMHKAADIAQTTMESDFDMIFEGLDMAWVDEHGLDIWMHDPENHHPLAHPDHGPAGSDANRSRPQRVEAIVPFEIEAPAPAHAPSGH